MNNKQLFRTLEMILISFGVAIFTLGFTYYSLFIISYTIVRAHNKIKYPRKLFIMFLLILSSGTFFALYAIFFKEYEAEYTNGILLRVRFFWIRIFFAFGILSYLYTLNYKQILKFVYYVSIPLTIAGLFQFLSAPSVRVSMLASEPSAAGMYYVFLLPLLIKYYKLNKASWIWIILFICVGLFIKSKAQILALPFFILYLVFKSNNKRLRVITTYIIVLSLIISPFLMRVKEIGQLTYFFEVFREYGIAGLKEKNGVWSSFTLRFSSFLTAMQLFYENLLGFGFGVFHPEYIMRMGSSDYIQSQINGIEISGTLRGELYATPKSIFFDYLVSSGLFFLLPLIKIVWMFINKESSTLIKVSLYGLLIVSLMVELSPFLTFLVIITTLFYKKRTEFALNL